MILNSPDTPKRLLVVDDQASVLEMLAEGLDMLGYTTVAVRSAAEAMSQIQQQRPDLVLSDIEMPGESGIDLLQKIKAFDDELDVIMVTGVVDAKTAIKAIRQGAADYVTKPFDLEEVQIVIERTLYKRKLIRENEAYQSHLEELVAQRTQALEAKKNEVQRLYSELEQSYERTLHALVTALDLRDNETQGHSFRVVEYAVMVAERMRLDPSGMKWIRRGAILHDVGKIGVSDSILRKPGALDEIEWQEMKRHPEMGYRMLVHIPFLKPALDIVLFHQERFDGSGYPHGLAGEQIPLSARIFAVVDTFDAMTSDRPYRGALPIEAAREEIRTWSGRQFDPRVVDAFLSIDAQAWQEVRTRAHEKLVSLDEQTRRALS